MRVAVVDCLATGRAGRRLSSVDVIGSGPRLVVGILKSLGVEAELFECSDVIEGRAGLGGFDVLMVSGMSSDLTSMVATLRRWRGRGPAVAGGPACTDYEELLGTALPLSSGVRLSYPYLSWWRGLAPGT